jgi:hypothetical protein
MKGVNYFLRRIDSDVLDKKFIAALNKCSERYNSIKTNYPESLTWFKNFVTATLIISLERMASLEDENYTNKIQDSLADYYSDEIEERWNELQEFGIRESVIKILKEESTKERIINTIDRHGLLHTLKVMNISYTRLFSIVGDEWMTRKIQIGFIKDLIEYLKYGFGLSEVGLEPIFYNENEDEYRQIDYIGARGATVDVLSKISNREDGEFTVSYFGLDDRIINELFDAMVHTYEEYPNFFS